MNRGHLDELDARHKTLKFGVYIFLYPICGWLFLYYSGVKPSNNVELYYLYMEFGAIWSIIHGPVFNAYFIILHKIAKIYATQ